MRFDPMKLEKNLQAYEKQNKEEGDVFLSFHLIDLIVKDESIENIDFDAFSREDLEKLLEKATEIEEYAPSSTRDPFVNQFNPVHEYIVRYEAFATLRNPPFRLYNMDDDFI